MDRFLNGLDAGVTLERARLLGLIALVALPLCVLAALVAVIVLPGWIPHFGQDFGASWVAARLWFEGQPEAAFDPNLFFELQAQAFGVTDVLLWHYPPTWHMLVIPFGAVPFAPALLIYLALSLAIWLRVAARFQPVSAPLVFAAVALSGPVWMCLSQGQNGLLVSAALGAVLLGLRDDRRWLFAGATALLLIKPHFGVLIPVILAARGRWDLFLWAAGACLAFLAAATLVMGPDYWTAFLGNGLTLANALDGGELWHQQVSVYAGLSVLGLPGWIAGAAQALVAAAALALTWAVWRGEAGWDMKAAVFLVATPMLSPYAFHYDLPSVMLGMALLARRGARNGFLPGERTMAAALWFAPLIHWPLAKFAHLPLLPALLLVALWMLWRRWQWETGAEGLPEEPRLG